MKVLLLLLLTTLAASVGFLLAQKPPPVQLACPAPAERGCDREMLRAELRQALGAVAVAEPPHRELAPPEPAPSTAEANDAFERAELIVSAALRSRRWTADDSGALRPLMADMTDEQRREIVTSLLPPVNRGELVVDVRGPMF